MLTSYFSLSTPEGKRGLNNTAMAYALGCTGRWIYLGMCVLSTCCTPPPPHGSRGQWPPTYGICDCVWVTEEFLLQLQTAGRSTSSNFESSEETESLPLLALQLMRGGLCDPPLDRGLWGGDRLPLWLSDPMGPRPPSLIWIGTTFAVYWGEACQEKPTLGVGVGCSHRVPIASHWYGAALMIVSPEFIFIMATDNDLLRET